VLYATQDRVAEFNSELQGFARLIPQMVQPVQMQAQALRDHAMQMRARGLPFPWQQAIQAFFFGSGQPGQPQVPHQPQSPYSQGGWHPPGYPAGPGGVSELEQAGDMVKAWWQKLAS